MVTKNMRHHYPRQEYRDAPRLCAATAIIDLGSTEMEPVLTISSKLDKDSRFMTNQQDIIYFEVGSARAVEWSGRRI